MFKKARITLTLWYLLILMVISVSFSAVIYRMLTFELDRFANLQKVRIETKLQELERLAPDTRVRTVFPSTPFIEPELIVDTKQRLLMRFLSLNGVIIIFAGGLSYFLAGRTLKPIEAMHRQQQRFISDSSHELRTPLTALKTTLEVAIRDKKLSMKSAKNAVKESIEEVNRLQYLTDNLLELSQHDLKQHFEGKNISLRASINQAIKRINPLIKEKKIKIEKKIKDTTFFAHEEEIIKLFVILIENAIKYSQAETVITIDSKADKQKVIVKISDQGIGIDKNDLPHIFDRFYRSDSARTRTKVNGYGLGLSIAKQIVELHRGTIEAKSSRGKGTSFIVLLPFQQ